MEDLFLSLWLHRVIMPQLPPLVSSPTSSTTPDPTSSKTPIPKGKPWLVFLCLILLGGGGAIAYFGRQVKPQGTPGPSKMMGPKAIPVKLETVKEVPVQNSLALVGTLEARSGSNLTTEQDGRISRISVREGDRVQAGQVVMELDTETLRVELLETQATLAKTQATLAELQAGSRREDIAQAQAALQQTEAQLRNAQQGASPEEIAQAQAQITAAQATAQLANERVKRYQGLKDEGVIPLDTFDQQLKEERQALADVEAAQRRLAQLKKGRNAEMERITAEIEEKRQTLRRLQNGSRPEAIAQAQAQVAEASAQVKAVEVKLQKSRITAPFSGVIGYIPVRVGDYVKTGDKLTTLTQNNALEINLPVPLTQASSLRLGLPVEIVDAQDQTLARGQISFISPNVDSNAQTVLARASFNNAGKALLNRQLVQAKIILDEAPGILVPAIAINRLGGETFVFVSQPGKPDPEGKPGLIAQKQPVQLGTMIQNSYHVRQGLTPGQKIVTAGLLNLQAGMPILDLEQMPPQGNPGKKP
ncbi:MAG: efflux RND transporter periplasmic adaptor subunit [Microcystaceae cyanobacterium]